VENIIKHFQREQSGVWTCLTTTTVAGVTVPSGARVLVGSPMDGIDVAQLLEEEYAKRQSGWS
jgi:hypothetical protein